MSQEENARGRTPIHDGIRVRIRCSATNAGALYVTGVHAGKDLYVGATIGAHPLPPHSDIFLLHARDKLYLLQHEGTGWYLFCSNDKKGQDNLIEAHDPGHVQEARNLFDFRLPEQHVPGYDQVLDTYLIYSPSYDRYLFVSNDQEGPPHYRCKLLEAHDPGHIAESRNLFAITHA